MAHALRARGKIGRIRIDEEHRLFAEESVEFGDDLTAVARSVSNVHHDRCGERDFVEQLLVFDARNVRVTLSRRVGRSLRPVRRTPR